MLFVCSCSHNHNINVAQQPMNKPSLDFAMETLEKPAIITDDKCFLLNSPKTPVICMLPSEYDKETTNYRKMLDIIKQYQASSEYYNKIK